MISQLRNAIRALDSAADQLRVRDSADLTVLAIELIEAQEAKRAVDEVVRALEDRLATAMDRPKVTVEGVGLLERNQTGRWVFPEPDLLIGAVRQVALARWTFDHHSGEIRGLSDDVRTAAEAVSAALAKVARFDFRVTGLKALDIDPERYGKREPGRYSVRIYPIQRRPAEVVDTDVVDTGAEAL